jgi:hypothetical protein
MRKILIAAMALTTLLYACTKEETPRGGTQTTNANLKIQFSNLTADTKTLDGNEDTQAANLKNAMVFILGASNDILSWHYFNRTEIASPPNKALATTTSATYVWVFCNLGDSAAYVTKFGACRSLTDLQAVQGEVKDINNGLGQNDDFGIWMVGTHSGKLQFSPPTGGKDPEAQAVVDLKLIPSRIDVTVHNQMKNYLKNPAKGAAGHEDFPKSLQLKDVSIIYSAARNYLFPKINAGDTSFIPAYVSTPKYYAAGLDPESQASPLYNLVKGTMEYVPLDATNKFSNLFADWDAFKSGQNNEIFTKTFYALPADTTYTGANRGELTLLIRAEHSTRRASTAQTAPCDSLQSMYFSVFFDMADVVKRRLDNGEFYNITVNLKGDAESTGGGTTNPNQPVLNANVIVTVNAGKWDKINPIQKTFN